MNDFFNKKGKKRRKIIKSTCFLFDSLTRGKSDFLFY